METTHGTICPSNDELADYCDAIHHGTADAPQWDAVRSHLPSCKMCQHTLLALKNIDFAITAACQPPDDLADRIIVACHTPGRREAIQEYPWWGRPDGWRKVGSVAALIALFGMATAIWIHRIAQTNDLLETGSQLLANSEAMPIFAIPLQSDRLSSSDVSPMPSSPQDMTIALSVPIDRQASQVALPAHPSAPVTSHSSRIAPQDLQTVGQLNSRIYSQHTAQPTRQLQDNIQHIWTVDNLQDAIQELERLDASASFAMAIDSSNTDRFRVLFTDITDYDLQQLVNRFSTLKWSLVSPFLPQPNEAKQVEFTGKKVNYSLVGVKRGY